MSVFKDLSSGNIKSEKDLRKLISDYPKILDKRIQSCLDKYCLEIIEKARLVVFASSDKDYSMRLLDSAHWSVLGETMIQLEMVYSVKPTPVHGSLYFLIPGVGHGLRVNGRLVISDGSIILSVNSAYVHCGRAIARSEFWTPKLQALSEFDHHEHLLNYKCFISASSYLFIKTMNSLGETELSPRGDQAGFVQWLDSNKLFIPERPGNKIAVSLRNILHNENVELLMMIPGSKMILRVQGRAQISNDDQYLSQTQVKNKRAVLGIFVSHCKYELQESLSLTHAQVWLPENQINEEQVTRFSKVLSMHMNGEGILGRVAEPIINSVVKKDLNNLY